MEKGKKLCPECEGSGEGEDFGYPATCYNCAGVGIVTIGGKAVTEKQEQE